MLCPIGQSNEKPPLQALAKWWEHVTEYSNNLIKSSTNKAEYWGIGKDYVAETHEIPYNDAG